MTIHTRHSGSRSRLATHSRRVLALLAVVAGTLAAASTAADAATPDTYQGCPDHNICVYVNSNRNTLQQTVSGYQSFQTLAQENLTSSWVNANTSQRECLYNRRNDGSGIYDIIVIMNPLSWGNVPTQYNDKADAVGFC